MENLTKIILTYCWGNVNDMNDKTWQSLFKTWLNRAISIGTILAFIWGLIMILDGKTITIGF